MKTVCKKLLCLMLVAMLLVSAVPVAFATECTEHVWTETVIPADCTNEGSVTKTCANGCTETTVIPALGHDWDNGTVSVAATCEAEGERVYNCKREGCEATQIEKVAALGHTFDNGVITKEPGCETGGVKTFTCECGEIKLETIAPLGHNMVNGVCTRGCGKIETYALTFTYLNADGVQVSETAKIENNQPITLPTIPLVSTKDFLKWVDGNGNEITNGEIWNIGESTAITAVYESDTTEDGIVTLTVYANYYVDGEFHHRAKLYVEDFELTNKNTMFTWLYSNDGIMQTEQALEARAEAVGYQWASKIFYDYYDDGAVTEADLESDGNKAVYIKVNSKDDIEASVMLYVHGSVSSTVKRVIPMDGYTAGDYVSHSAVKSAVKNYYSGSNMSVSDLYSQSDWEDLLDGLNSSGSQSIKVETNGITKIHVIVKNATSSGTADPSNPKTGDDIMIAVTTMGLTAAALVSLVELKKRKMI